ncbi:hypothetical protein GGF31_004254 [Allomyces arbusculus]|nr:hypothetical protein GGF31_004254 [Allomyces arbusculus]
MTKFQDQDRVPNSTAHCKITDMALHVSTLAELKALIESDPSVRAFITQLLADFTQAHGQQRGEKTEAANAEDDKKEVEEKDATPAVDQFRTKNGKGKPVATAAAAEDASVGSSSSPSPSTTHHGDARSAAAAGSTSADATKAPCAPTSTRNVSHQRAAAARPAVIPPAPLAAAGARVSSPSFSWWSSTAVPTGVLSPHETVPKAERHDLLQYIGPASVHEGYGDGAHLPSHIPREITSFIDDVRMCVSFWETFDSLYYVEYHGGTWFVAAGLLAYLHRNWHRTNYNWNYDDYVSVCKEIQGKLLEAMTDGNLHGIRVGDDMLAPGNDAGKGGNNGWPWMWFVRFDVYKARFA